MLVKIDATTFELGETNELTPALAKEKVSQARKERRKLQKALKNASSPSARKASQHDYVTSQRVRFATIIDVAKKLPMHERPAFAQCWLWSIALKLHEPIPEAVWMRLKAKSGGEYRYYLDFGVCHTAAQRMVAEMLKVQFKAKPYQFSARRSGGVAVAVSQARALMGEGFVHIRRLDIKKFFDSFSHAAMLSPALPIAHKVAEHVVIGRHYNVKVDDKLKHGPNGSTVTDYLDLVGHAGIPQGSAVSPLIGEFFTSQLGVKMPKGARFINFVDDYLVLAKSPTALIKAENALKSAVANLPVGDFELLEKSGSSPYSPDLPSSVSFEFLGHAFFLSKGKVVVHVIDANFNKADTEIGYC